MDGRRPRLVRVDDYGVETPLEGHVLFTRHADQPGVIGLLGEMLGRRGVNISRMQVGVANGSQIAIAALAVSKALEPSCLEDIARIEAVEKALQIEF